MQKSENKIKPMYSWGDSDEEYGLFRNDLKKIRDEEIVDVDEAEDEFEFEQHSKIISRQSKKRTLKNFLRRKAEFFRRHKYLY